MSAIFGREDGMKIVIGERGGGGEMEGTAFDLESRAEGRKMAGEIEERFQKIKVS